MTTEIIAKYQKIDLPHSCMDLRFLHVDQNKCILCMQHDI